MLTCSFLQLCLATLTAEFSEIAKRGSQLSLYFCGQRQLVKNTLDVSILEGSDLIPTLNSLIQSVRLVCSLLLPPSLDWEVFEEGRFKHFWGVQADEEGWDHDDGPIEAPDIANEGHQGVEASFMLELLIRKSEFYSGSRIWHIMVGLQECGGCL